MKTSLKYYFKNLLIIIGLSVAINIPIIVLSYPSSSSDVLYKYLQYISYAFGASIASILLGAIALIFTIKNKAAPVAIALAILVSLFTAYTNYTVYERTLKYASPANQSNAVSTSSTFHGKECKDNCQGHIAGYRWAKMNSIDDVAACMTPSPSFAEGCASYVEENGFFGTARVVISWLFIISGGFFMASGLLGSIKSYFHVIAGSVMIMAGWFAKGMYAWWPLLVGAGIAFYMAKLFVMKQKSDMINAMYGYK